MSHAAVLKLIGNASEGNMSKMLSPGRSSDSYFWEMRTWSLKKVSFALGHESLFRANFWKGRAENAAPGLSHHCIQ